jgi:2-succinyl-6-hydroxy-2,4-cyclohexadiene-1-carboxylate synthase
VPIVFVPGFTQTTRSCDAVRAALELDARAVDIPQRATFAATARAIGDAGGAATYVGYSMGGRLCLQLALDRPELVTRLVLVSASPGLDDTAARAARRASDEELARSVERDGVDAFLREWLAQPLFATVPANAPGLADRRALSAAYLAHCLRVLGTGAMDSLWDRLAELTMPVVVVTGRKDAKFTAIAQEMMQRLAAGAVHDEVDAGHAIPLEAPVALARVIERAVARH